MSHTIRIEGSSAAVEAEPGDTVLDALLMGGVHFAYSCQAGNCGTCRCELVAGDVLELECSEHALAPADRARGVVLACRTQVWSDVVIRRLDDDEFVVHPSRVLDCVVRTIDRLTPDVWRLRLDISGGGPFTFSAGQYASLVFPFAPDRAREYSMASAPHEPGLEFHIRDTPGSTSAGLGARVRVGDAVRVSGPFGSAQLRDRHPGPVLAIAGGTGVAPVRAILLALDRLGASQPVHVYIGVRREQDIYGEAELVEIAGRRGWKVQWVLSEAGAAESAGRRSGLVTDAVAADLPSLTGFKAYVAGPPAMVEAAAELLRARGLALRDFHADAFQAAERAVAL